MKGKLFTDDSAASDKPFNDNFVQSDNSFRSSECIEKPRQIFTLSVTVCFMVYYAYNFSSSSGFKKANVDSDQFDIAANPIRESILAVGCLFLVYCFLHCRDTILTRPHPGIWRVVHGMGVLYVLLLVALVMQNQKGARDIIRTLIPDIGPEKVPSATDGGDAAISGLGSTGAGFSDGASSCKITTSRVLSQVQELWFIAHVVGWWGKMLLFRDWAICFVLSIGFELLEMSMQWFVPEFKECWWDSLIIDFILSNISGMALGWLTIRLVEVRTFNWSGFRTPTTPLRSVINRLSPLGWSSYNWEIFSSLQRFAQVVSLVVIVLVIEFNAFMLLNTLSIPKESYFNRYRLFVIWIIGLPASKEYYLYCANPANQRLGPNVWTVIAIMQLELVVWVKFLPQPLSAVGGSIGDSSGGGGIMETSACDGGDGGVCSSSSSSSSHSDSTSSGGDSSGSGFNLLGGGKWFGAVPADVAVPWTLFLSLFLLWFLLIFSTNHKEADGEKAEMEQRVGGKLSPDEQRMAGNGSSSVSSNSTSGSSGSKSGRSSKKDIKAGSSVPTAARDKASTSSNNNSNINNDNSNSSSSSNNRVIRYKLAKQWCMDILILSSLLPLVYLCKQWGWH